MLEYEKQKLRLANDMIVKILGMEKVQRNDKRTSGMTCISKTTDDGAAQTQLLYDKEATSTFI